MPKPGMGRVTENHAKKGPDHTGPFPVRRRVAANAADLIGHASIWQQAHFEQALAFELTVALHYLL